MPVVMCNACKGLKKYWGVGMMRQYDCETCNGTGVQEIKETKQDVEIAQVSKAKAAPKKKASTKKVSS